MTGFFMRSRVLPPEKGTVDDTARVCMANGNRPSLYKYCHGDARPHFPVPAVPVRVGWQPEHPMQMYPSSYWWITSPTMLWSIFSRWGLIVEKR